MKKFSLILGISFLLLMSLTLIDTKAAFYAEEEIVELVDKQAKSLSGSKAKDEEILKAAEKKAEDAEEAFLIMEIMSKRRGKKGGVGIGAPGKYEPDGIEAYLINLRKRVPDDVLGNKDFVEMADRVAAIASYNYHLGPKTKKGRKDPKDWKKWSADMLKGARELSAAVKAKDAAAVKTAAKALNTSCVECHNVFR